MIKKNYSVFVHHKRYNMDKLQFVVNIHGVDMMCRFTYNKRLYL